MYAIQQKGINKNCEETLRINYREVEKILQKSQVFTLWKNKISNKCAIAHEFIPEIFMDAYISILFSSMGFYKQANMCLRAQLETTLRLIYFATHSIEYKWWLAGNEWYLDNKSKDVWGPGFSYFMQLEDVKNFDQCDPDIKLFNDIKKFYKILSKYVHSGPFSFQTHSDRISPKYVRKEFKKWIDNFNKVQTFVNIVLILGFKDIFISLENVMQKKILKTIENDKYKNGLRQSLKLKFRGKI